MTLPIVEVVEELVALLGLTTVAVIGGVKETRAVSQWTQGRDPQRPHVLRFALQLAYMIASDREGEIAKAWFHGPNPGLDDRSPMILLRERPIDAVQASLLDAARAFAAR
jgi:hypothetical protein